MRVRLFLVEFVCLVTLQRCFCVFPLRPVLFPAGGALPTLGGDGLPDTGVGGLPTSGGNGIPTLVVGGGGLFPDGALSRNELRSLVPRPTTPSPSTTSSPFASPTSTSSPLTTSPSSPPTSSSPTPSQTASSGPSSPSCSATQTLLVGVCVNCSDRIGGCTECSTSAENIVRCTGCLPGLVPADDNRSCISGSDCGTTFGGCTTCTFSSTNNQVECTACLPGLAPADDGQSCESGPDCSTVITGCDNCAFQNSQVECTECDAGLFLVIQTTTRCLTECGYALYCGQCTPDPSTLNCPPCSSGLPVVGAGLYFARCNGNLLGFQCDPPGTTASDCSLCASAPASETLTNPPTCSQCAGLLTSCAL